MKPRSALLLVTATVAVAAIALMLSREPPPKPAEPALRPPPPVPVQTGPTIADALQRALEPEPEPEALRTTPVVGRVDAEAGFDALMDSLDDMADREVRLTRERRHELYRNINDAFSGLSATLDPNDAGDMQLLEDANIRMKAMMDELKIRAPMRIPVAP